MQLGLAGVSFVPADRTPTASKHTGQKCHGLLLTITDREALRPMELGVALLATAGPGVQYDAAMFDRLAGTDQLRLGLQAGRPAADIAAEWQPALDRFAELRERYLLY